MSRRTARYRQENGAPKSRGAYNQGTPQVDETAASFLGQPDTPTDAYLVMPELEPNPDSANNFITPAQQGTPDAYWQHQFVPASSDWVYEEADEDGFVPENSPFEDEVPLEKAKLHKERKVPLPYVLLILLALAIIMACLVFVFRASKSQDAFDQRLAQMQGTRFFDGIKIDNLPVVSLTPVELRAQAKQTQGNTQNLNLKLNIDNETYVLTNEHIAFERNLEAVMEEAWSIGRQGSISVINSQWTPFEGRWRQVQHTKSKGASFYTKTTYSKADVDKLAADIATAYNREPVNAVVASFDFSTQRFEVTQDVKGRHIEAIDIAQALTQALNSGNPQANVNLTGSVLLPKVSSVDLNNSFTRLSSFSTKTGSDNDRNNNIALAAMAISNRTLMPGETFSFNETTGQRTIQKGYLGAPAIQGGVLIDDVGGGVCQVSSTLFYAAAQADMAIVERSPHAWPVSYMDKGLDATVNWPNLDFKFKNNKDTPVFIIASYQNRTLTVEFYGMLSSPGESVELQTELVSTMRPPSEPIYQQNPNLPFNTQKELKQAREGYVVDTFRVYLRNGSELRREKLFTSRYKEVQQVIEYN